MAVKGFVAIIIALSGMPAVAVVPAPRSSDPACQAMLLAAQQLDRSGNYLAKLSARQDANHEPEEAIRATEKQSGDDLSVAVQLSRLHYRTCR